MLKGRQATRLNAGALAMVAFAGFILFSTTLVQAKNTSVSTRSLGGASCSTATDQLTAEKSKDVVAGYTLWLSGYITSRNVSAGFYDIFPVVSPSTELTQFFFNICSSNPDAKLLEVVEAAVNLLISKGYALAGRLGTPEIVLIPHGGGEVPVYKDFLIKVQQFLNGAGHRISADGRFGSRTKSAIADYKKKNKLGGPPLPDSYMLQAMVAK